MTMINCRQCDAKFDEGKKKKQFCSRICKDAYHNSGKREILSVWKTLNLHQKEMVLTHINKMKETLG